MGIKLKCAANITFLSEVFLQSKQNLRFAAQLLSKIMKKDIHPENYRPVVFKDMSNDFAFMSKSAAATSETITWEDGNEYPLFKLEISSESHPFFTGKMQLVDTAGRVDKFKKRYAKFDKK